jgi:hypothetical protein
MSVYWLTPHKINSILHRCIGGIIVLVNSGFADFSVTRQAWGGRRPDTNALSHLTKG